MLTELSYFFATGRLTTLYSITARYFGLVLVWRSDCSSQHSEVTGSFCLQSAHLRKVHSSGWYRKPPAKLVQCWFLVVFHMATVHARIQDTGTGCVCFTFHSFCLRNCWNSLCCLVCLAMDTGMRVFWRRTNQAESFQIRHCLCPYILLFPTGGQKHSQMGISFLHCDSYWKQCHGSAVEFFNQLRLEI